MTNPILSPASAVALRPEVMAAEMDGETVILEATSGMYSALGATGSRIVGMIAEPVSIADICAQLMTIYEVDAETCTRDVTAFLEQLNADGFLVVTAG